VPKRIFESDPNQMLPYITIAVKLVRAEVGPCSGVEILLKDNESIVLWFEDENAVHGFVNRLNQAIRG
jgi:hypothetical protein